MCEGCQERANNVLCVRYRVAEQDVDPCLIERICKFYELRASPSNGSLRSYVVTLLVVCLGHVAYVIDPAIVL